MSHDASEGLSPGGWLPDRVTVGALTQVFTPELRRRSLPSRLMVYFVLSSLWLFRGRNCGYVQVLSQLADGTYLARLNPTRRADGPAGRCG
ncbi:transposase domain-containing protein [Frankia sp. Cr1]|uniref:transposase domain-containing protein n=1 Tax=Frankia sp. Cr1 TaxID=3073931 RepID=UPI002AD1D454|nr:transposase domain-containing protein [Frankia sp. Cr1]